MSYQSGRLLTPGASRKRKEREVILSRTSTKPLVPPTAVSRAVSGTNQATTSSGGAETEQLPLSSNRLLAGYMAYEFLTKGTLFGQKFDLARLEAVPASSAAEWKRNNRQSQSQLSKGADPIGQPKPKNYAEVANLLKNDGAHIPGIVNPTQLARWIQM